LLINHIPVPSQMIVAKTVVPKNLLSIISKMFIQLCAKMGGIPWTINQLPFADQPTMVIGLCHYKKSGDKSGIYSMVATTDQDFSRYWSVSAMGSSMVSFANFVENNICQAVEHFNTTNGTYPCRLICIREGLSAGEEPKAKETEIRLMRESLVSKLKEKAPKILYVAVSRDSTAKFFVSSSRGLENPNPGTFIQEKVAKDANEFFLICQKPRVGMASPCAYRILENDLTDVQGKPLEEVKINLACLIFKLSYLYYNTTGSIKVPAPIHYADKLATFIGEKSLPGSPMIPHEYLRQIQSLYYI